MRKLLLTLAIVAAACSSSEPSAEDAGSDAGPPMCGTGCPTFFQCCGVPDGGAACVDIVNDPANCGGCGVTCSGECREAACVTAQPDAGADPDAGEELPCGGECDADQRCCGTTCIARLGVAVGSNGRTDPSFSSCNGCDLACDEQRASACSVPSGGTAPRCMCGSLNQCPTGEICVPEAGSFTCVSTSNDPNNCGSAGNRCDPGQSCVMGVCE